MTPKETNVFIILSVELPVGCKVLGCIGKAINESYGPSVMMRQTGDHLEFFLPAKCGPIEKDDDE